MMPPLGWVMVAAKRGDRTISWVKREGGTMQGNVTTSQRHERRWCKKGCRDIQGKQEGGMMRGKVTMSRQVERWWQRQGDATTSQGKLEGGALRGNVITSRRLERWWHNER